ncbi:unnamed protein product [Closterium sp. NIES-53]
MPGVAGGAAAEGDGTEVAGGGGPGSGDAGGVGVEATPVEDTAASSRRPRRASPPGFLSVPQFPPRSSMRPVAAEPRGVPAGGTGSTGGVVGRGAGSGVAGAKGVGTLAPTLRTQERLEEDSRSQQQVRLEQQKERVEEEPQPQQQGQVARQQPPKEAEQQRLRDLLDLAPARFVRGPLPSPLVHPNESLSLSLWSQRNSLNRAVSPEPRRSHYRADDPFHLVLCSRVPPLPVFPHPPESSRTLTPDRFSDNLRALRPVVAHFLSTLVTPPTSSRLLLPLSLVLPRPTTLTTSLTWQFELGFLAAVVLHLCAMLLAPKVDLDALYIPTLRTHAEAVTRLYTPVPSREPAQVDLAVSSAWLHWLLPSWGPSGSYMSRGREVGEQGGVAGGGVGNHQPANPMLPSTSTPSPTTADPMKSFSTEKFMGEDYEHWSFRRRPIYTQYKLLDLVEGKEKMPEAAELKGAWMKLSFDAYMLMVQVVGGRQLDHIKDLLGDLECGPKAWRKLMDVHSPTHTTGIVLLTRRLRDIKFVNGEPMQPVLDEMRDIFTKLQDGGVVYPKLVQCVEIVTRLPDSWSALAINFNTQQPQWSVDYILACILEEDLRRRSVERLEEGAGYGVGGGKSGFKKK